MLRQAKTRASVPRAFNTYLPHRLVSDVAVRFALATFQGREHGL